MSVVCTASVTDVTTAQSQCRTAPILDVRTRYAPMLPERRECIRRLYELCDAPPALLTLAEDAPCER